MTKNHSLEKSMEKIDALVETLYKDYNGKISKAIIQLYVQLGLLNCKSAEEYQRYITTSIEDYLTLMCEILPSSKVGDG